MSTQITFFIAFLVVLALIGAAAWLVRRFAGNRLGSNANRGRMPRLAVIDAAAVDGRRRLVLVRRDNVEHLLMIGGPSDIVVEANILRATPAREPGRPTVGADGPPRVAPLPEPAWEEESVPPPQLDPPTRPSRPAFLEEARRPAADRRDAMANFSPEPPTRPEPRGDAPPPRSAVLRNESGSRQPPRPADPSKGAPLRGERPTPPAPPSPAKVPPNADQNLAEMANRLEAALRRSPAVVEATEPRVGAPPVQPEGPVRAVRGESSTIAPSKGFENLEDEMASLLGRPKSPS